MPSSVKSSTGVRPAAASRFGAVPAIASTRAARINELATRIAEAPLNFPTSVHVALRVVDSINTPNCSLAEAARLLQIEPLLSTKVVAVSNTVAFNRSGRPITSVQDAVQLVGLKMLKALAISVAVRQLAAGAASGRAALARRLWDHSVHVAALAYVIARRLTGAPGDAAMFAGIVHELSGFYLLSQPRKMVDLSDVELGLCLTGDIGADPYDTNGDSFESLAARVCRPLLQAMRVPEPIVDAVSVTWDGYLALPPTTLGDTLMLADILAPVRSPFDDDFGSAGGRFHPEIDLVMGRQTLTDVLEESDVVLKSLLRALRA